MIRTYSDTLIALDSEVGTRKGVPIAIITAEEVTRNARQEVKVVFYGNIASGAATKLVSGVKFNFRGFIATDHRGELELVGLTFSLIA